MSVPRIALAVVGILVLACQTALAPGASPPQSAGGTQSPSAPAVSPSSPSSSPAASPAPLEACSAGGGAASRLSVFVGNRDPQEWHLEIVGADGACNWPIGPAGGNNSLGGVTVRAGSENIVRLRRVPDCSVVVDESAAAGIYTLEISGGTATLTKVSSVDTLGLGADATGPCTPM
jgi:hypothetical protein